MAKGIVRKLIRVRHRVDALISAYAGRSSIAAGLASEGYNGGYRDALDDVMLALNGVQPNRHHWWDEAAGAESSTLKRPGNGG
jgi:hypothetical protein